MRALLIAFLFFPSLAPGAYAASPKKGVSLNLTVTAYNAVTAQTSNKHPHITASGAPPNAQIVAAVTPMLLRKLPFGTVVRIKADTVAAQPRSCDIRRVQHLIGYRVVLDTMSPNAKGELDVLFPEKAEVSLQNGQRVNPAVALGVCRDVSVEVVEHLDPGGSLPKTQAELIAMIRDQRQANSNE